MEIELKRQLYPLNLNEFIDNFGNEDFCWAYMESLRWPDGFMCPKCGVKKYYQTTQGKFRCKNCRRETTVTAGTILNGTPLKLNIWYKAAWIVMQKRELNAQHLQDQLKLTNYETAWAMAQRLRKAITRLESDWLRGTVAVDRTQIATTGRGKTQSNASILMAVEDRGQKVGRICLRHVTSCSGKNVREFVKDYVKTGSTILTVKGFCYQAPSSNAYTHQIIAKQNGWVQDVEISLKSWLNTTHSKNIASSNLQSFLDEFAFHHNRKLSRHPGRLFHAFLKALVTSPS